MSEDLFPHPDPGDVVGVTLDGRERALALVEAVTPTGAELAFDHAPAGVDDLTGLAVQMDFAGVDGMWRVDGQLAPVSAIAAEDGYRLRFEVTSTPQLARHRRFVRTNLKSKVSLFLANGERLRGHTINVSADGLLIADVPQLALGDEARFALFLDVRSITGSCRVVRVQPRGVRAVSFLSLTRQTQHRLIGFLFEREHEQRSARIRAETRAPARGQSLVELVEQGARQWREGDLPGARAAYQRVVDSGDPDHAPRAALYLAGLLSQEGDTDQARLLYERATASRHPDHAPRAALSLGMLLLEHGDTDAARRALQHAVDMTDPAISPAAAAALRAIDQT